MVFDILKDWDGLLELFPSEKKDIYFTKRYVGLYEADGREAMCVACQDGDKWMLMPFLRGKAGGRYDFETAYGYGGAIANSDDIAWCRSAFYRMCGYLRESGYVCGFIRFHPLMGNEALAGGCGQGDGGAVEDEAVRPDGKKAGVLYDRQTIAMDTSKMIKDIWEGQISSKNRNMIRKAEKNGLEYKSEYQFDSMDGFVRMYQETMGRLHADDFYFFNEGYFKALPKALSGNAFLGTVRKGGRLVCAAIFLYSDVYGHYHLSGSDRGCPNLGANNYLLWKAACEMHALGVKEFHLGGGATPSPTDTLLRFKRAFSGNTKSFYIGKQVYDAPAYAALCKEWEGRDIEKAQRYSGRLLKYRY